MKQLGTLTGTLYSGSYYQPRELFTITMPYGTERWTNASIPTTSGTATFQPKALTRFKRQEDDVDSEIKLEVSAFETGTSGQTMMQLCLSQSFRNVPVTVQRAYMSTSGTLVGDVTLFGGYVTKADGKSTKVTLTVASGRSKLFQDVPDRGIQASCPWVFGDSRCTYTTASATNTCTTGSTTMTVNCTGSVATYQPLAALRITSGPMSGTVRYVRSVSSNNGNHITLDIALPQVPANGVTFTVARSCDRTRATCNTLGNLTNFGGCPDMPLSVATGSA